VLTKNLGRISDIKIEYVLPREMKHLKMEVGCWEVSRIFRLDGWIDGWMASTSWGKFIENHAKVRTC